MEKEQALARIAQIANRWRQIGESLPIQKYAVKVKGKAREWSQKTLDYWSLSKAERLQFDNDFDEVRRLMKDAGFKGNTGLSTDSVFKQMGVGITDPKNQLPMKRLTSKTTGNKTWGNRLNEIKSIGARGQTIVAQTDQFAKKIRVKPELVNELRGVLKSSEIEKHHILILKAMEPFFMKGPSGMKPIKVRQAIMKRLADEGFFVGDINQNIAWINKWAHKLGSPGAYDSAHKYLRSLTDIEGRTIAEAAQITYKAPKGKLYGAGKAQHFTIQNLEGIKASAWPQDVKDTLAKLDVYTQGDLSKLQKVSYKLANGLTYDASVGYGFARETRKYLWGLTDADDIADAALLYLDDAGAGDQMIGAVLMAVWNNPDVGDAEKVQMLADTPKNTRRLFEVLDNATKPTSGPHAHRSGNINNLSEIADSFRFQSAQPGLMQTPEGITMAGGATAADEALEGLGKGLGQRMQDFDTARQLESVQNAAKWSEAWGGTGLKLGRKLGTLVPIAGVGLDAWDAVERHKHASREGASDLDKFQAWVAKFTLGSAAVPVYGQAANLAGGLLNLGIDTAKFGYQYTFDEEYREDTNESARALGGMTQDALRQVLRIGQY